jgi:hypothetical protein
VQYFFLSPPKILITADTPLLYFLVKPLGFLPDIALIFLYHTIVIFQAMQLNYVTGKLRMFNNSNYTAALSYVLLCGLLPEWNNITPALIANSFILWSLSFFGAVYGSESPGKFVFNVGVVTGISVMLYPPVITLFGLMMLAIIVLRSVTLREVTVYIFGFLLPFYFLAAGLFLKDDLSVLKSQVLQINWHPLILKDRVQVMATSSIIILFLLFWGIYFWQNNNRKLLIIARRSWSIFIVSVLFFVPGVFLFKFAGWDAFLMCIIPCAAISANGFYYSKNTILSALIFWIVILVVLFNNFGGRFWR